MTPEEIKAEMEYTWQSRKETLTVILQRIFRKLDEADPYEAVAFTSPLATLLIDCYHNAYDQVSKAQADDIINSALNPDRP